MRNNVIYLIIPILLIFCLTLSSCEDLLTEKTRTDIDLNEFAANAEALNALLIGTYADLRGIMAPKAFVGVAGTDIAMNSGTNATITPLDRYKIVASLEPLYECWKAHFALIQDANLVIERAVSVQKLSPADRQLILGQARFLRAWCYFRLVQYFGELPLLLEETKDFHQTLIKTPRYPISDIYGAILADLEYASQEGVLSSRKDQGGRVTHWAAKTLLAKVYITMGSYMDSYGLPGSHTIEGYREMRLRYDSQELYRKAYDLLSDVIANAGYSLNPIYYDNFLYENKNNSNQTNESIWEIQFSSEVGLGSNWSKQFGVTGGMAHTAFNGMKGNNTYKTVPSFWFKYRLGDMRRNWTHSTFRLASDDLVNPGQTFFSSRAIGGGPVDMDTADSELQRAYCQDKWINENFGVSKYRWGSKAQTDDPDLYYRVQSTFSQNDCPNNVIVLRYADVLLLFAEADMRLSEGVPTQKALDLVNGQIIRRARGWKTEQEMFDELALGQVDISDPGVRARYLTDYTQQTLTLDELLDERGREFAFEFQRWFDLVRFGKLKDRVEARVTCNDLVPLLTGAVDEKVHYLFPIPQRELEAANNEQNGFAQNPGY